MPRISPFVALRFDAERAGPIDRVTAPPYDVISDVEHERLLSASEHNITRLDLGERAGTDPGDERYARAAALLASWRRDGVLVETDGPVFVAYEMAFRLHGSDRRIRGVIAAVELEDWGGSILPHEHVMAGPVEDRLRLLRALATNVSCIECIYAGPNASVSAWLEATTAGVPMADVVDDEGVRHRVWVGNAGGEIAPALEHEPLMIADGHHRYTTALRYRDEMRAAHGAGPWDRTLMLLIDGSTERPPVLPFHRIQLGGVAPVGGDRVRDLEEVLASVDDASLSYGSVTLEDGALVHRVARLEGEPPAVCALHAQVLRTDASALRFSPDAVAAEEAVRSGEAVASYFLPPTDASTIRSFIERGERLPEKSTFFWPKPRTGFVLRPLDLG
jgi:uncharacterized protein (DUF1015 family)